MKATTTAAVDYLYVAKCVWQNLESRFIVRFPSWPYYMSHLACFIFTIIQTLLTIFLNYLAVHALCKSTQLRRKTTLFLVLLLSVNDLAIGVITDPILLLHFGRELFGVKNCLGSTLKKVTLDILPGISVAIFIVLNGEIYLSIIHPIFHKIKVTNRRALKIVCVVVFISMLRSYLFAFHISKLAAQLFVVIFLLLTLSLLTFIHVKIAVAVYKRRRVGFVGNAQSSNVRESKSFLHGVREAKSCLLVLFCTVLCYLPAIIEDGMPNSSTFVIFVLNPWRNTFVLAASFLNCIVFFWRNAILRKEAKKIFRSLNGRCSQNSV